MAQADTESKPVDQDALVADIDRTRAELAATIDAISDRVSPKKNARRALDQVRSAPPRSTRCWRAAPPPRSPSAWSSSSSGAAVSADRRWRRRKR